jgi:hypothetical protein
VKKNDDVFDNDEGESVVTVQKCATLYSYGERCMVGELQCWCRKRCRIRASIDDLGRRISC